ncbi:MAG: TonB-dependent receptor plug domain-containing protein, partial [Sodaliphilus sp.]|nr:TonB-dependent receptor plug domain-containing protein [Sodaliphilus sp.]
MAVVACLSSSAQDAYTDIIYRKFDLDEVVVTGTRTPKFLKDTPIQTRVINAKEIARLDATNVQDLLQQELPGVEFTYAMNQQTHLNFSGFGGQGVLFLVDGERLAGETMDDVDFTRLSMDNVERIEIVKGAASALYGSNATGGVINIITKKSQKPV